MAVMPLYREDEAYARALETGEVPSMGNPFEAFGSASNDAVDWVITVKEQVRLTCAAQRGTLKEYHCHYTALLL